MLFSYIDFVRILKYYFKLFLKLSIALEDILSFVVLSFKIKIIKIVAYNKFELVKYVALKKSSGI